MRRLLPILLAIVSMGLLSAQSLQILTEEDPPLNYLAPNGELAGLSVDIVREIQRRVGNKDPINLVPWARGLNALGTSNNVLLFSMGRTAQRNPNYQWIGPIYQNKYILYSLADAPFTIASIDDAKKLSSVGVYRDDIRDQVLTALGFTNLSRQNNTEVLVRMLFARRLDVIAAAPDGIGPMVEKIGYAESDVRAQLLFFTSQLYIGASLQLDPSIVAAWNRALDSMRTDGTLMAIFRKHQLENYYPGPAITEF